MNLTSLERRHLVHVSSRALIRDNSFESFEYLHDLSALIHKQDHRCLEQIEMMCEYLLARERLF